MNIDPTALGKHVAELARAYIDRTLAAYEARFKSLETSVDERMDAMQTRSVDNAALDPIRKDVAALVSREAPDPMAPVERFASALTERLLA